MNRGQPPPSHREAGTSTGFAELRKEERRKKHEKNKPQMNTDEFVLRLSFFESFMVPSSLARCESHNCTLETQRALRTRRREIERCLFPLHCNP